MVAIYHPETQATVDVPGESLSHYRRSGWVTKSEWDEAQEQAAASEAATSPAPTSRATQAKAPEKEK